MVAQAEPHSVKTSKRAPRQRIPLFTRIKAKNLYVGQMAPASVVAAATGLSDKQVWDLAQREGWTKLRNEVKLRAEESVNARAQAGIEELVEHVANETAELSLGTLAKAKRTLERDDEFAAKDLQAYSVAAKNFVGLYRQAKQLDVAAESGSGSQINVMFVGALPRSGARNTQVNVTPQQPGSSEASESALPAAAAQPVIDVAPAPSVGS